MDFQEQVIRHRYYTRSQTRRMAEKDETRFEWLERSHQETREQISKMMEMIRALIRKKRPAIAPNPQSAAAQPERRREDPVYPQGSVPLYVQTQPIP